jgi:hypothetical protein
MFSLLDQKTFENRPSVLRAFGVTLILGTLAGLCRLAMVQGGVDKWGDPWGGLGVVWLPYLLFFTTATVGALIVACRKAISLSRRLRHTASQEWE